MEIFRMFVDPHEDFCDLRLVFFTLQNFLPRRPLRHLVEFKHVIDEHPVQYQNQNIRGRIERTQQSAQSPPLILRPPPPPMPYSQHPVVQQF